MSPILEALLQSPPDLQRYCSHHRWNHSSSMWNLPEALPSNHFALCVCCFMVKRLKSLSFVASDCPLLNCLSYETIEASAVCSVVFTFCVECVY